MNYQELTLAQIESLHPFPWTHRTVAAPPGGLGGLVQVIDAAGAEVALFALIQLAAIVTAHRAGKARREAA
jgi:hypothetical protein